METLTPEQIALNFSQERAAEKAAAEVAKLTPEEKAKAELAQVELANKAKADAEADIARETQIETVLEKPEAELTDEEKALLQEEIAKEESLDEKSKMERGLKKSRKRIDRLTAKLREAEDERSTLAEGYKTVKDELEKLRLQVEGVTKPKEDGAKKVNVALQQAIIATINEDVELPREERREMDNDSLQEWFAEDPVKAGEWIAQREVRRAQFMGAIQQKSTQQAQAEQFMAKQQKSVEKFVSEFPNSKPDVERGMLLKAGSTIDEANAILEKKYPEFKLTNEIVDEAIAAQKAGRASMLTSENFGEELAKELKARMQKIKPSASKPETKKVYTEEEVEQRVKEAQEMERQRVTRAQGAAAGSSSGTGMSPVGSKVLSKDEEFLTRHAQKAGMSSEQIERIIKRHNDRVRNGLTTPRSNGTDSDDE